MYNLFKKLGTEKTNKRAYKKIIKSVDTGNIYILSERYERKINAPWISRTSYTSVRRLASDCRYSNSDSTSVPPLSSSGFLSFFFSFPMFARAMPRLDVWKIFAHAAGQAAERPSEREREKEKRENSDAACPIFLTSREDIHLLIYFTIPASIDKSIVYSRTLLLVLYYNLAVRSKNLDGCDATGDRASLNNQLVVSKSVSLSLCERYVRAKSTLNLYG